MLRGGITKPEQCFNTTDPITLNDLTNLSDEAVIRVPGPAADKFYCFEKPSLQNWRKVNATKNPATNLDWTAEQLKVIENELGMYWGMSIDIRVQINEKYVVDKATLKTKPPFHSYSSQPTMRQQLRTRFQERMTKQLQTLTLKPFHRDVRILSVLEGSDDLFFPAPDATPLHVQSIRVLAFVKNSNVYLSDVPDTLQKIGIAAVKAYVLAIIPEMKTLQGLPDDFFTRSQAQIQAFETRNP